MNVRELGPGETALAARTLLELRPGLGSAEALVRQVDERQRPTGYRLVGVFADGDEEAAAVAGFRINEYLAWGRHLYLDDLVTAETDIQPRFDMNLQLRTGIAKRRQGGDGRNFAAAEVKTGTAVNIAEGKLEYIGREIRSDVGKCRDHLVSGFTVDLGECSLAAFQPAV